MGISGYEQNTLFLLALIGLMSTYLIMLIRPSDKVYAKNGKKWIKKYQFLNTTEETKSHKDGSFEIYYTHHFKVLCKTDDNKYQYEYEIAKNGGVSGKDNLGRSYSKKISEKLFLKNIDVLEDDK
jgi:hypothetical protein